MSNVIEWYHIYLFTRIDSVGVFFAILTIISSIIMAGWTIFGVINHFESSGKSPVCQKQWWLAVAVYFLIIITGLAIPTQKEVAAIYLIPKIVNSESAQNFASEAGKLPTDVTKLMRIKLEQWANDMLEDKGKGVVKKKE